MNRHGFTLVELLVVIAIIGILVALLMPAIQAAREAARAAHCRNNIRQIALAFHLHHDAHGHFPGDGWGWRWAGDPDRGSGVRQPGGWLYKLLPFIEASEIAALGHDGQPDVITPTQRAGLAQATQQHVPWFNCPTRRSARLAKLSTQSTYHNMDSPEMTNTISYNANWGSRPVAYHPGPSDLNLRRSELALDGLPESDGVVYPRSEIAERHITGGTSKTYLVGGLFYWITPNTENPDGTGLTSPLSSFFVCSAVDRPARDALPGTTDDAPPQWGGPHPASWNVALCDGSVRTLSFDIDLHVHRCLASRHDSAGIPD